jgi:hypothetical protein
MKNTGGRMAAAKKSEISDRGAYTRTEKQLLALLGLIACMIVFLTLRR